MSLYTIRTQMQKDLAGLFNLYSMTLGEGEAQLIENLRAEGSFDADMSLVAVTDEGIVLGHILFSALPLASRLGDKIKGSVLAPMAVLSPCQKMGIGSALVKAGLKIIREKNYEAVVVVGHTDYYPRFGFSLELGQKIQCKYSGEHLMALELKTGVLQNKGKIAALYPQSFNAF